MLINTQKEMIMRWKNILNSFVNTCQKLTKSNEINLRNQYLKDLASYLDSSFKKLKKVNEKLDQLSQQRATKLQVLDDKLFLDIHSYSGTVLMVVRKSTKKIINVNEKFYNILKYSPQDIIGQLHSNVNVWVNNQDSTTIENLLQECQIIKQQIFQLRTESGDIKDFLLSAEEIDIDGQVLVFYMASDITDITENSCFISYRCLNDADYTMKYISYDCENLTEYKVEEVIGNNVIPFGSIIYQEDFNYIGERIQQALQDKKAYEIQYRIKTKSGDIKWVWERGQGIFYDDGDLFALEGLIEDITGLKNLEDELSKKRNQLREQIEQTIKGFQDDNLGFKLAQEIPVLMDALNVENIVDIAALTKLLIPQKIADNVEPELYLAIIALNKVARIMQCYQIIKEPIKQNKTLLAAKEELKAARRLVNDLPASLQVLISQIITAWESILNDEKISSEDV